MKLAHLSDLHLGKRLHEVSLLEDQADILWRILEIVDQEQPDAMVIAGDVYDKPIPPTEAVELFDAFLFSLSQRKFPVFLISGNHDSAERLSFGSRLMDHSGIHICPAFHGKVEPFALTDEYGVVDIFLLPFFKPIHARHCYGDDTILTYTDAMRAAIGTMELHPGHRSVLVTHQFVGGADCCESEQISIGGSDMVDAAVFAPFDYVALGHLHGPQNVGSERLRYCGTPLKYSFSEAKHTKSVTMAQIDGTGAVSIRTIPLKPLHELVELRGTFAELTQPSAYLGTSYDSDYLHITLTDETDIPDAVGRLRTIYHNLLKLDYDNQRTRRSAAVEADRAAEQKSADTLFADFYELQNNQPMTPQQRDYIQTLVDSIWRDENAAD